MCSTENDSTADGSLEKEKRQDCSIMWKWALVQQKWAYPIIMEIEKGVTKAVIALCLATPGWTITD